MERQDSGPSRSGRVTQAVKTEMQVKSSAGVERAFANGRHRRSARGASQVLSRRAGSTPCPYSQAARRTIDLGFLQYPPISKRLGDLVNWFLGLRVCVRVSEAIRGGRPGSSRRMHSKRSGVRSTVAQTCSRNGALACACLWPESEGRLLGICITVLDVHPASATAAFPPPPPLPARLTGCRCLPAHHALPAAVPDASRG